jgi:hypothetical protein
LSLKESNKNLLYRTIQTLVIGIAFYYIFLEIVNNWNELKNYNFSIKWVLFLLSFIPLFIYYFSLSAFWFFISKNTIKGVHFFEAINAWFYSMLGKYIPGKIMLPLGRAYLYKNKDVHSGEVLSLFFLETAAQAGGAFLLIIITGPLSGISFGLKGSFYWIVGCAILLFSHPKIIEWIFNVVLRAIKREEIKINEKYPKILFLIFLNAINLGLIGGFSFYLLISSFYSIPLSKVLFIAMALGVSSLSGLIAFFAPAGIGVREGVLIYLLGFFLPSHLSVIVSIISRIWLTVCEIILISFAYILKNKCFG